MFVLITSEMNETDFAFNDAELYETLQDARQWVEISQGYDLEAGDLQQYAIYEATEVAIDSEQTDGLFVRSGAEMLVYDSFEEIVERVNEQNEVSADLLDWLGQTEEEYRASREATVIYRLADEATQIITEVIDEELLAA
jgi:hypothetical protein